MLVVIGALVLAIAMLISRALSGIFGVALYRYALEGEVVGGFTQEELESAVKVKKGGAQGQPAGRHPGHRLSVPELEVRSLTKRYGKTVAVDDLSFAVEAGRVTGFLGPNGAGKTTTMRALLGLLRPSSGEALVEGRPPTAMADPLRTIGAALEATAFHPGRSGRNHLRMLAAAAGIPHPRVEEVLEMVELTGAERRRVKGYSLGMRQRLALAAALLGEPRILILDEPANGLDPQGMRWLRDLLRAQAGEGRTVLVSSHLLSEVAQTADELVVIQRASWSPRPRWPS